MHFTCCCAFWSVESGDDMAWASEITQQGCIIRTSLFILSLVLWPLNAHFGRMTHEISSHLGVAALLRHTFQRKTNPNLTQQLACFGSKRPTNLLKKKKKRRAVYDLNPQLGGQDYPLKTRLKWV